MIQRKIEVDIARNINGWRYYLFIYNPGRCGGWVSTEVKSFFKPICYLKFRIWWIIYHRDDEYLFFKEEVE